MQPTEHPPEGFSREYICLPCTSETVPMPCPGIKSASRKDGKGERANIFPTKDSLAPDTVNIPNYVMSCSHRSIHWFTFFDVDPKIMA
jgi:hypothetical protein